MKKAYFFDFDGTLTYRDTMFMFLKFSGKARFYKKFFLFSPLFALLKLGLANPEEVKRKFIESILSGRTKASLEKDAEAFAEQSYPKIFRPTALDFIKNISAATDSYLVSASLDIWLKPFAQRLNMQLISTEADFEKGVFTGRFKTPNCNGAQKPLRIAQAIRGRAYDKKIAFGDTVGDKEMLDWADEGHYRFFH